MSCPAAPPHATWPFAAALLAAICVPTFAQDEAVVTPAADQPAVESGTETSWGVMLLGGERIGWTRSTTGPLGQGEDAGTRSDVETNMTFSRFGQEIKMSVALTADEGADGRLRAYKMVTKNPGSAPTTATGERDGDLMRITSVVNGKESTRTVEIPADAKGPSYLETVIAGDDLQPGRPQSFRTFFPDLEKVGTTTVAIADGPEAIETPTGEIRKLTAVTVTHDVLPIATTIYVDEERESVFDSTNMLGQAMITYEVTQEEALRAVFGKGGDVGFDTLVTVDVVPNVHQTKRIVYEVVVEDAAPTELFLATESQRVEPLGENRARVTVTGLPIPETATAGAAPDLLKSTRYLQCDDARVIAHATAAAPADAPAGAVAVACAKYVKETLTNKNFSTALASAAEVAEKLSGDCTEHSVLCAAMMRARGIPARVCVGLVTIPGAGQMGGHMWVETLLDADGPAGPQQAIWTPLDPSITGGPIGGGHLLLGRSDLDDGDDSPVVSFLPMLEVLGKLTAEIVDAKQPESK
ncbi:MAG: transglutaminase domain-containing protein [Planctomycetota bacterium]